MRDRLRGWPQFAAWVVVGAAWVTGLLGVLSIGLLVLPLAALGTALLLWRRATAGAPGALSGAGLALLYVAYLNRGGPGTVCTATAGGTDCLDEWSPWPWLAAGVAVAVAGAVLFVTLRARAR
ncbi:hypothetical protein [Phaeacidiphilus oryzae]|uniref:hypothetical protein n=1 Tax=Phaeacidiphilus oryzae TaxID=348818 RepID=UPI000562FA3B|nr:hypothetical protein [Phaeacidiphilus oryzae]